MNIKKFIYKKSKLLKLFQIGGVYALQPMFLLIHLTFDCNCNCDYCYQSQDLFYKERNDFIRPKDFENILKEATSSFLIKPQIHFFGGEPLLNPYFAQFLKLIDKYGMKSSITTNGLLVDEYINKITKSSLGQLNISIDEIGTKYNQKRKIEGGFEKVINNIQKLRGQSKKKKIININCIINHNNYQRLTDLAFYFQNNKIDIDVLVFQHMYFKQKKDSSKINLDVLKSQIKKLSDLKTKFDILLVPEIKPEDLSDYYYSTNKNVFKNNCILPWLGMSILPNLEITPGGTALGCKTVVGDLRKQSLKEIWNGKLMKEFRKNIIKKNLPESCFRCCHREYY